MLLSLAQGHEQLPEALHLEPRLADLAAPVGGPERLVDGAKGREGARRSRQAPTREGGPQGARLGAIEVEESTVEVEENGPDP